MLKKQLENNGQQPVRTQGYKMRIGPPYPHEHRKRPLKWGGPEESRKKVGPVSVTLCLDGLIKESYKMSVVWES